MRLEVSLPIDTLQKNIWISTNSGLITLSSGADVIHTNLSVLTSLGGETYLRSIFPFLMFYYHALIVSIIFIIEEVRYAWKQLRPERTVEGVPRGRG